RVSFIAPLVGIAQAMLDEIHQVRGDVCPREMRVALAKRFPQDCQQILRSRNLVALHKHLSGSRGVWLPRPMTFDEETGLVVMEELPGKDLIRALREVDLSSTMREGGEMLATFHQAPRVVRRSISLRETLKAARPVVK